MAFVPYYVSRRNQQIMAKRIKEPQSLTNMAATKILKSIYVKNEDKKENPKIILNAMNIYNSINEPKDYILINAFLKMCLHYQHPEKISLIWRDIDILTLNQRSKILFSYLLKCSIQSKESDIDQSLEILRWMKQCKYNLKIHESWLIKLITKCDKNINALNEIASFINNDHNINNNNIMINTALINGYGKCGDIESAQNIFNCIADKDKDAMNISSMMKIYINNYNYDKVIDLYQQYDELNDDISHLYAIEACIKSMNISKGKKIYSKLKLNNKLNHIKLKSALIELYGICGHIKDALQIYNSIPIENKNIVIITTMINAFIHNHLYHDALKLYDEIQLNKDEICHILAFKVCINMNNFKRGKLIHNDYRIDFSNIDLQTALIEFYSHFTDIKSATTIFKAIPDEKRTTTTINAMINGYLNIKSYINALRLYNEIENIIISRRKDDISHILASIICINKGDKKNGEIYFKQAKCFNDASKLDINKCIKILQLAKLYNIGGEKHCVIIIPASFITTTINKCGQNVSFLNDINNMIKNIPIANKDMIIIKTALINAYGKSSSFKSAQSVFDSISNHDIDCVVISVMMKIYHSQNKYKQVLQLYDKYYAFHDQISHLLAIGACIEMEDWQKGKHIHNNINIRNGEIDIKLKSVLLNMYGKCGDIDNAIKIFKSIPFNKHDVITISSMLNAFCKSDNNQQCIKLFNSMTEKYNIEPNLICYAIVLTACTNSTSYYIGQEIHNKLRETQHLKWMLFDSEIQTCLISLYGKCGILDIVQEIFDNIKDKEPIKYDTNISIWNAMIHSYGRNGKIENVKKLYNSMECLINKGLKPNKQTYIALINAFGHSGDLDQARNIWNNKIKDDNIKYDPQIVTTIIDSLSRNGALKEAYKIIQEYDKHSLKPYHQMWISLLSACKKHQDTKLATKVLTEIQNLPTT